MQVLVGRFVAIVVQVITLNKTQVVSFTGIP